MPTDLHIALQLYYAGEDGGIEVPLDGYRADVLRDGVVYEIQTGSFGNIRAKLEKLARKYPIVLVYPVAQRKQIVYLDPETGEELASRKSPKRGDLHEVFGDLLHLRTLLRRKNVSLEIALLEERELRQDDGQGSWRRRGVSIVGRQLTGIVSTHRYQEPKDLLDLLPADLPRDFTTADLQRTSGCRKVVAGRMAYALRHLGVIRQVGKQGNAYVYRRVGGKRQPATGD